MQGEPERAWASGALTDNTGPTNNKNLSTIVSSQVTRSRVYNITCTLKIMIYQLVSSTSGRARSRHGGRGAGAGAGAGAPLSCPWRTSASSPSRS